MGQIVSCGAKPQIFIVIIGKLLDYKIDDAKKFNDNDIDIQQIEDHVKSISPSLIDILESNHQKVIESVQIFQRKILQHPSQINFLIVLLTLQQLLLKFQKFISQNEFIESQQNIIEQSNHIISNDYIERFEIILMEIVLQSLKWYQQHHQSYKCQSLLKNTLLVVNSFCIKTPIYLNSEKSQQFLQQMLQLEVQQTEQKNLIFECIFWVGYKTKLQHNLRIFQKLTEYFLNNLKNYSNQNQELILIDLLTDICLQTNDFIPFIQNVVKYFHDSNWNNQDAINDVFRQIILYSKKIQKSQQLEVILIQKLVEYVDQNQSSLEIIKKILLLIKQILISTDESINFFIHFEFLERFTKFLLDQLKESLYNEDYNKLLYKLQKLFVKQVIGNDKQILNLLVILSKLISQHSVRTYKIHYDKLIAVEYFNFMIFTCEQLKDSQMLQDCILPDQIITNLTQSDSEYKHQVIQIIGNLLIIRIKSEQQDEVVAKQPQQFMQSSHVNHVYILRDIIQTVQNNMNQNKILKPEFNAALIQNQWIIIESVRNCIISLIQDNQLESKHLIFSCIQKLGQIIFEFDASNSISGIFVKNTYAWLYMDILAEFSFQSQNDIIQQEFIYILNKSITDQNLLQKIIERPQLNNYNQQFNQIKDIINQQTKLIETYYLQDGYLKKSIKTFESSQIYKIQVQDFDNYTKQIALQGEELNKSFNISINLIDQTSDQEVPFELNESLISFGNNLIREPLKQNSSLTPFQIGVLKVKRNNTKKQQIQVILDDEN